MTYMLALFLVGLVVGLIGVASNPSPYFAAYGLVVVSGFGCGILAGHGGSFLCLILFLIYLGGMVVVFVYSAALVAEPYPESWVNWSVAMYVLIYAIGISVVGGSMLDAWCGSFAYTVEEFSEFSVVRADTEGVALMYSSGGVLLFIGAWVLLLTLIVVLELTRGSSRGTLRAV
uniref:NADH-ubiquinone oxidoreductase chain 6 n=1 Tax=Pomacanthus xanthometopon TaxID=109715 RepID=A0A0U1YV93_POMXA|nr:NADH dehydrogenase subunit 6 [Pomacanthus xanthometopon]AJE75226.1 NADH dehydrogenase subunit 6 [Pomacanthus xanthometopon]